ncbi:HIT family protein [Candidatus Fermentibacteria bacterium]|nr:HIT family protein [Candidatus Fermentibacteria bacterium]
MTTFGAIEQDLILAEDDLFIVARDKFPVSPGHTLVIVRRVVSRFLDLTAEEKTRLLRWIDWSVAHLQNTLNPRPDGFNIGLNDGPAAGQTIAQLHVHIIPRYRGDIPDPRGGVRHVIPQKAKYWSDDMTADLHDPVHLREDRVSLRQDGQHDHVIRS